MLLVLGTCFKNTDKEIMNMMKNQENYSNIFMLYKLLCAFPISSCEPERIFSEVNNTITKLRNRLSIKVCNQLLLVSRVS